MFNFCAWVCVLCVCVCQEVQPACGMYWCVGGWVSVTAFLSFVLCIVLSGCFIVLLIIIIINNNVLLLFCFEWTRHSEQIFRISRVSPTNIEPWIMFHFLLRLQHWTVHSNLSHAMYLPKCFWHFMEFCFSGVDKAEHARGSLGCFVYTWMSYIDNLTQQMVCHADPSEKSFLETVGNTWQMIGWTPSLSESIKR